MKRILLSLLIACFALHIHGTGILLEAEAFKNAGGWKIDQQFMDIMGSPYLIAHGMGQPVADASTDFRASAAGYYHAYVRTYNWTSPWSGRKGPGKFQLAVNGTVLSKVLGEGEPSWQWTYVGKVKVKSGINTVRLKDLTGFDGRCDAIYLCQEQTAPPETAEALQSFRREHLGYPRNPPEAGRFDLVVVGGGVAGIGAAVSAARLGLKVALLQDRPILGGNNSSEVRVHLGGMIEVGRYPRLGGLLKEYGPAKEGNAMAASNYEDENKLRIVRQEKNLSLFLNHHVSQLEKDGNRITSVIAQNIQTGERLRFSAPLFADCTGDGTVGYLAGADYRIGRESSDKYGESRAPEVADNMIMGVSVQWYSGKERNVSRFPDFSYGMTFNEETCEKVYKGEWTWETGMYENQIDSLEKVRDYGLLVVYSNWSYLKNHSEERKDYEKRRLQWVAYIAGKRETRRLLGDYVLSQQDLTKNVYHEDGSFTTSWSIDLHFPDSINSLRFPGREFKADTRHTVIYPCEVPYRCLYSRNVDNLFMAGRNISVTHVALGSVRVMRTTAMMGEVVGMAAAVCRRQEATPREVYQRYLPELKALMRRGIGGQGLPNNQDYNEGGHLSAPPIIQ